MYRRCRCTV